MFFQIHSCLDVIFGLVFHIDRRIGHIIKRVFSICITSGLCLRKWAFRYGSSQKMLCFIQLWVSPDPGHIKWTSLRLFWNIRNFLPYIVSRQPRWRFTFLNAILVECILISEVGMIHWQKNWRWQSNQERLPPCFELKEAFVWPIHLGHANLPAVLQPDSTPYVGESSIVHVNAAFSVKFSFLEIS
jgi:hypothetical protein